MPRPAPVVLFAVFLAGAALIGACASASDAYQDGMERETAGDYAGAARDYITSLERDPTLPNVRGRLAVAGREAVRESIARAATLDAEGAAQTYLDADALVARAGAVGVDLDRPATFAADRDAALARAVAVLAEQAADALGAAEYAGAIGRLGRARAFRPTAQEAARLDALALDAFEGWAEADLAAGRYRDALARTEAALSLGPDAARADALTALRLDVLAAGTVVVAVLPPESDDAPAGFLRTLHDVLLDDALADPPPFVALVDPAEVRRWSRAQRRRGPALSDSPRRLGDAAADLGADLAVVLALGTVSETSRAGTPRTERAETRAGAAATWTRTRAEMTVEAEADVVAATAQRSLACDRTVAESATETFERGAYDGDWRDLDLSRAERRLFADDAGDRAYDRALEALRDALADAAARVIGVCAGERVG